MRFETYQNINLDIDEIIDKMDRGEKEDMYSALCDELNREQPDPDWDMAKDFQCMTAWEQKKMLCNALGVASYHDEQALREKLEEIIKAQ